MTLVQAPDGRGFKFELWASVMCELVVVRNEYLLLGFRLAQRQMILKLTLRYSLYILILVRLYCGWDDEARQFCKVEAAKQVDWKYV